jgi:hypothetical protein
VPAARESSPRLSATPTRKSATNCYTDLQTIYNSVLADPDGRLIACTVTPFKGDSVCTAGREADRITLNTSIRGFVAANANSYLVDLATMPVSSCNCASFCRSRWFSAIIRRKGEMLIAALPEACVLAK